jgi:hypothetical protein
MAQGDSGCYPLTFAQEAVYPFGLAEPPAMPAVNISYRIEGELDVAAFATTLELIVRRHDAFRLSFRQTDGGEMRQFPGAGAATDVLSRSLVRTRSVEQFEHYARSLVSADRTAGWKPGSENPFRFRLLRLAPQLHAFSATMQHIIFDGRSLAIFERELWTTYAAQLTGHGEGTLPPEERCPAEHSFLAAARRQRERFGRRASTASLQYWRHRLARVPPFYQLACPHGGPSPGAATIRPSTIRPATIRHCITLGSDVLGPMRRHCRDLGYSLPQWILASLASVLFAHTRQGRLVIVVPISSRARGDHDIIGMFVDGYPLVIERAAGGPGEFLPQVRNEWVTAMTNRHVDGREIVAALYRNAQLWGTGRKQALLFSYLDVDGGTAAARETNLRIARNAYQGELDNAPSGLILEAYCHSDHLVLQMELSPAVFSAEAAQQIFKETQQAVRSFRTCRDADLPGRGAAPPVSEPYRLHQLTDSARLAGLDVDLVKIRSALMDQPGVARADVAVVATPGNPAELAARIHAAGPVDISRLREHCYQLSLGDPAIAAPARFETTAGTEADRPEPAATDGLGLLLSEHCGNARPERGFWECGGSFAAIRSIRRQASARGLPVPRHSDFFGFLCLRSIARQADSQGDDHEI